MVELLDNKLIKLEIMPGTKEFQEAQRIAEYQGMEAAEQYAQQVKGDAGKAIEGAHAGIGQAEQTLQGATKQLPEEHQEAASSYVGMAGNAATGVVTTLGGTVKGVGDTVGNTVSYGKGTCKGSC